MLTVGFLGLSSAGKSTFINALAGRRVLQSGVCRTTTEACLVAAAKRDPRGGGRADAANLRGARAALGRRAPAEHTERARARGSAGARRPRVPSGYPALFELDAQYNKNRAISARRSWVEKVRAARVLLWTAENERDVSVETVIELARIGTNILCSILAPIAGTPVYDER